jgi:hypothetical protein
MTLCQASSGRAPRRARVVDQDVDHAVAVEHLVDEGGDGLGFREVAGHDRHVDVLPAQVRSGLVQLRTLAGGQHQRGTLLAERLGDLQAEPTRSASDDGGAPAQVEQFPDTHWWSFLVGSTARYPAAPGGHRGAVGPSCRSGPLRDTAIEVTSRKGPPG